MTLTDRRPRRGIRPDTQRGARSGTRPDTRSGTRRRALIATASAAGVLVAALAAWGTFLLWPRWDGPAQADAVVMLAGADDGRHAYAAELIEAGYAGTVLVSNPGGNTETVARRLCTGTTRPSGAEVVCFSPDPRTTWGEAEAVSAVAELRGWERLVVVTNRPHALRADTWMRNATGLDVHMAPIDRVDVLMLPVHLLREVGGWVKGRALGSW